MLNEDPRLSFLHIAWSRSRMAEFFNRHVVPTIGSGEEVTAVSIEDMTYIAGTSCEILYSLQFRDSSGANPYWAVVAFASDDRLEVIYTKHYRARGGASTDATTQGAVYLPEYRCLVEFFPRDYRLSFLARAMDAREVARLFPRRWTPGSQEGSGRLPRVRVLVYHPRRTCVLRYVSASAKDDDPNDLIGKVYPEGPKAARAWQSLNVLHAQAGGGIVVPAPLMFMNEWNTIFMECVQGTPMKDVLRGNRAQEGVRLAARALAVLHGFQYGEGQAVRRLETQLEAVRHRAAGIDLVAPQLDKLVETMLAQISQLGEGSDFKTPCFLHGDYKPDQLLLRDGRVAVVDFDRAWWGDPALDVGSFMAVLHKSAVKGREYFRELASGFLAEYTQCLPQNGFIERARLFQITALVRMAVGSFRESPRSYSRLGPDSFPARLLREAEGCLAVL
jgi:tRNA A-37 threonylcarbamoyl transferase component Bud32